MKKYICLASVTVKAPTGYKPRTSTYTLACCSETNNSSFRKKVEEVALNDVERALTEQNPGMDLKYSVTSKVIEIYGIIEHKKKTTSRRTNHGAKKNSNFSAKTRKDNENFSL